MRRALPLLLLVMAVGCATGARKRQSFMDAVRGYNDGLRWQRHTHAAAFIPPAERGDFVDERAELSEDLRIDDYEVSRVRLDGEGNRAKVQVVYTWHRDSRGLVYRTTTLQEWERHGKLWQMVEESRVRGETMPGVPEERRAAPSNQRVSDPETEK